MYLEAKLLFAAGGFGAHADHVEVRPNAGEELAGGEGFDEVVVGTGFESLDLGFFSCSRREKDDRYHAGLARGSACWSVRVAWCGCQGLLAGGEEGVCERLLGKKCRRGEATWRVPPRPLGPYLVFL